MTPDEQVNHPIHYNMGGIETIDAIEAWGYGKGFNIGSVVKYASRHEHKGTPIRDLKKSAWYALREIGRMKPSERELIEQINQMMSKIKEDMQ